VRRRRWPGLRRARALTPRYFADIPAQSTWKLTPGAAYVHICANETIQGVEFKARRKLAASAASRGLVA
jgi:phosphoserine aminotransferase